jgi:hypothetical protein
LLSEKNLLELGLDHLAGGVNATESLAQTLHDFNHMNTTTANSFKLVELAKYTATGRMRHNIHASHKMSCASNRTSTNIHENQSHRLITMINNHA